MTLVGIDLGKHAFHQHAQDKAGRMQFRKKPIEYFSNFPPCTVVMEVRCAGAHCMARKLTQLGHHAKLIYPNFVRPFVKGNKNDFVDADAICVKQPRDLRYVS